MCGQPGHFRRDCPRRKEHSNPGTDHKARTAGEKCSKSTIGEDKSDSETSDTVEAFTASTSSAPHQMDKWLIDSGASSHMTWEKNILKNYKEFVQRQKVSLGDGRTVDAVGVGDA